MFKLNTNALFSCYCCKYILKIKYGTYRDCLNDTWKTENFMTKKLFNYLRVK